MVCEEVADSWRDVVEEQKADLDAQLRETEQQLQNLTRRPAELRTSWIRHRYCRPMGCLLHMNRVRLVKLTVRMASGQMAGASGGKECMLFNACDVLQNSYIKTAGSPNIVLIMKHRSNYFMLVQIQRGMFFFGSRNWWHWWHISKQLKSILQVRCLSLLNSVLHEPTLHRPTCEDLCCLLLEQFHDMKRRWRESPNGYYNLQQALIFLELLLSCLCACVCEAGSEANGGNFFYWLSIN